MGVSAGLVIGLLSGTLVGKLAIYLRREYKEALGLNDFLALGLIALSYGIALLAHSYGFLAVFAAGLALRRIEMQTSGEKPPEEVKEMTEAAATEEDASHPEKAPAHMAQAVLVFNEQVERMGEVAVVVLVGGMLSWDYLPDEALWFVPLFFFVIRPVTVTMGLIGSNVQQVPRRFMSWFGIRGIGLIYYLMYAIHQGVSSDLAQRLTAFTLTVVAISIVLHGISVTPLMNNYGKVAYRHQ